MQKIVPHLWFDTQALEAAALYTATFPDSKITKTSVIHNPPPYDSAVDVVSFELMGLEFQALSAGPMFKFNPSVSFMVVCTSKADVDAIWDRLSPGGMALMELGEYPFSERFGWLQDKYGLTWQILYSNAAGEKPHIIPFVMFVGSNYGRAEEAMNFWSSVFPESKIDPVLYYSKGEEPDQEGKVKQGPFSLFNQKFIVMDSAYEHRFEFNEAISIIVNCETQDEIDTYWNALSAVPEAEACGWLKDKFGFSWQIVPTILEKMMADDDPEKVARVTQAVLDMKKLDIAGLQDAYDGR